MNTNLVKGILIALVIVDHNDFSREFFSQFLKGFSFHVVAFLALPFIRVTAPLSLATLQKHFYRLYYPFLVVAGLTGIIFWLSTGRSAVSQAQALVHALYSGNANSLKHATNMSLLWFLPSLFSLMLIKGLMDSVPTMLRKTLMAAIFIAHFVIGAIALRIQDYLPLGILPALYVVPLVYMIATIHRNVLSPLRRELALFTVLVLFIPVKYAQMRMDLNQEVGFSLVADYTSLDALFVNDLEGILGTLLVFQLGRFSLANCLDLVGQHSLAIYLLHAFLAKFLYIVVTNLPFSISPLPRFILTAALTLILSAKLAQAVMNVQLLRQFLFPRNGRELMERKPPYPAHQ